MKRFSQIQQQEIDEFIFDMFEENNKDNSFDRDIIIETINEYTCEMEEQLIK